MTPLSCNQSLVSQMTTVNLFNSVSDRLTNDFLKVINQEPVKKTTLDLSKKQVTVHKATEKSKSYEIGLARTIIAIMCLVMIICLMAGILFVGIVV